MAFSDDLDNAEVEPAAAEDSWLLRRGIVESNRPTHGNQAGANDDEHETEASGIDFGYCSSEERFEGTGDYRSLPKNDGLRRQVGNPASKKTSPASQQRGGLQNRIFPGRPTFGRETLNERTASLGLSVSGRSGSVSIKCDGLSRHGAASEGNSRPTMPGLSRKSPLTLSDRVKEYERRNIPPERDKLGGSLNFDKIIRSGGGDSSSEENADAHTHLLRQENETSKRDSYRSRGSMAALTSRNTQDRTKQRDIFRHDRSHNGRAAETFAVRVRANSTLAAVDRCRRDATTRVVSDEPLLMESSDIDGAENERTGEEEETYGQLKHLLSINMRLNRQVEILETKLALARTHKQEDENILRQTIESEIVSFAAKEEAKLEEQRTKYEALLRSAKEDHEREFHAAQKKT
eukprot:GHVU01121077.1.p1 GENE.GHVU01121077.1~~GHVU01121077.1.p1  ORF type:complete len:406 (+),score=38.69 GHVU01121077.1:107-1324(+)